MKSPFEIERRMRASPATYVVSDILEKDGKALVDLPLMERKKVLRRSVKDWVHVVVSDYVEVQGEAYFEIVSDKGLEGIIAKRKDSRYEQGLRTDSWKKIKNLKTCDCVVFGFTEGKGYRASTFGALVVGLYDYEGNPVHVANVGTGFNDKTLYDLGQQLNEIELNSPEAPFEVEGKSGPVTWVKPELVCEVVYMAVTPDLKLRHPRFHRLRTDKSPSECRLDQIVEQ